MHHQESIKLLYLPEELGGSGMKTVKDTYKFTKIKMANYLKEHMARTQFFVSNEIITQKL